MNRLNCVNNPDCFCYICGKYTVSDQRKNMTKRLRTAYKHYFGCKIGDQTKSWAPHICCTICYSGLTQWLNGKRNRMPFAIPMIWREQKNHDSDCYFCTTNISGYCKKNKSKIVYPDCESALKPVVHSSDYPVPIPPSSDAMNNEESDTEDNDSDAAPMDTYDPESDIKNPHLISQVELDYLVRDLSLSKEMSEVLGSRLKEWNLLETNYEGKKTSFENVEEKAKSQLTRKRKRDEPTKNVKSEIQGEKSEIQVRKSSKKNKNVDTPVPQPESYELLGNGPPPLPSTGRKYVGCHVSGAGGIFNCFENGRLSNAASIALFLRNQRSWNAKPLDEETIKKWDEMIDDFPPHLILPHGSYLMNLGSPKEEILEKSRKLFVEELQRCEKLRIPHFNFHPGSTLGIISREECCRLIAESINLGHKESSSVICVIENMSCQGFTVGGDFHEIRLIIEGVQDKSRVGVCLDTCHAHAAGYDLSSEKGFNNMVTDFEKIIGWQFLRGLHINDSKGQAGDHKDRHEVIGKGYIGKEGFKRIMNYPKFNDMPLILETPFVSEDQYAEEIKLLRNMIE